MTPLAEIRAFPMTHRQVLETQFGITSAEAFFERSIRNAAGLAKALCVPAGELSQLTSLVESHLSSAFVARCRQPVQAHSRGVIVK